MIGKKSSLVYFFVLLLLFGVMAVGYFSFLWYVTQSKDIISAYSLYIVAVFAAIATFFSPCSFGLLPGYLSYHYTVKKGQQNKGWAYSIYYGALTSFGLVTFNAIIAIMVLGLGVGIANAFSLAGGGGLSNLTLGIRFVIGIILLILGASQFFHLASISVFFHKVISLNKLNEIFKFNKGEKETSLGLYLYGFGYNLGNIGCTGPLLGGLIVLSLASGITATLIAFLVYSLVMAALMIVVSLIVGLAEEKKLKILSGKTPEIQKISALVLAIVGLFIISTSLFPDIFVKLFFPK